MKALLRWPVLFLATLAVVGATLFIVDGRAGPDPRAEMAEELRDEIRELQDRVDDCLDRRVGLEARFHEAMDRTEELRRRVEELESLDPEGVPAERYREYLEVFDEYNDSLPEWEQLGEALREQGLRCRRLAEAHNDRLERLRDLLLEMYSPMPPPV
jgi:DNA-directed RNA polymerase specialized sigma54-like protein